MKRAYIVYFADKSANVVICESMSDISSIVGIEKFNTITKVDLIPFEVL